MVHLKGGPNISRVVQIFQRISEYKFWGVQIYHDRFFPTRQKGYEESNRNSRHKQSVLACCRANLCPVSVYVNAVAINRIVYPFILLA